MNITRIHRAGVEFVPSPGVHLQFGDRLTVVGSQDMIAQLAAELGNSLKELDIPEILPVFLGIIAGVVLGSLPLPIPGLPLPLKLGLAGGPLVMAILISRFGNIGRFSSYVPRSANLMLREVGIVLFLACVGLRAGADLVPTLASGQGLLWLGCGALITMLPLLLVVFFARLVLRKNYLELCGLMAGSMTDPPALAFANGYTGVRRPGRDLRHGLPAGHLPAHRLGPGAGAVLPEVMAAVITKAKKPQVVRPGSRQAKSARAFRAGCAGSCGAPSRPGTGAAGPGRRNRGTVPWSRSRSCS